MQNLASTEQRPFTPSDCAAVATIWTAACSADLRITTRFVEFNTQPPTGVIQSGRVAMQGDQTVGFVLASALPNDPLTSSPELGWIDALAVLPVMQGRGVGSALLEWAEQWLTEQGCTLARLGGSLRPFVAGYPVELGHAAFFHKRRFDRAGGAQVWDVARDLGDYTETDYPRSPKPSGRDQPPLPIQIRPAQSGDENALCKFLQHEFPNRWRFEFQEFLRLKGRISDWHILLTARGIDGFARLTFEDSVQPYERFFPYRLPRPWGQLGPVGLSRDVRGQGYGRELLNRALTHLRARGVRGAVIDWTHLLDFYAKFGFKPFREYLVLIKKLR